MTTYERVLVIAFLVVSLGLIIILQLLNWGLMNWGNRVQAGWLLLW